LAVAATILVVGAMSVSEAAAVKPAPLTGNISCSYSAGTIGFKKGLGTTPSAKAIKVKGSVAATASGPCTGSFTGGKFTVSAVSVKITGSLPAGSSCTTLATGAVFSGKVQVKFLGKNPAGKLATVAVDDSTIASSPSAGLNFSIVSAPITKGGFVGQTVTVNATVGTLTGSCTDADPLTAVAVSGTVTSP
jgi:hypothetical protein